MEGLRNNPFEMPVNRTGDNDRPRTYHRESPYGYRPQGGGDEIPESVLSQLPKEVINKFEFNVRTDIDGNVISHNYPV